MLIIKRSENGRRDRTANALIMNMICITRVCDLTERFSVYKLSR